jgi:hypothetical protein
MKACLLIFVFVSMIPLCGRGEFPDYAKDVLPIMKARCWDCHSNEHQVKGNLALDDLDSVREDQIGKYNIIRPGDPVESGFVERLKLASGHTDFMPRKGSPLPEKEIETIEQWILGGAIIDASSMTPEEKEWIAANKSAPAPSADDYHHWTNSQGRTIEAKFVSLGGKTLKIRMKNGSTFDIALDTLSGESAALAETLAKE